jgi:lipopolysaccharide transport system ATP-binding protein
MSSAFSIRVRDLSKRYAIYESPADRLKQSIVPRLLRLLGRPPKRYFREFWALSQISFEIGKGETVGIIGRNGSGKSTLLQLICGTLTPTTGTIEVNGRVAALLELGSGFNPEFTGRENIYVNGSLFGLSRQEIDARLNDIEAFADIGDFIDQPVKTYSSGMHVRLAFAVIAHVDADILIIDEALAVGDAYFVQRCMRFLRNFMQRGTVLFVSHDIAAVKSLCDRAIWLERGEVIEEGPAKGVCESYMKAFFESQQGNSRIDRPPTRGGYHDRKSIRHDPRLEYLNASNLRNDLKVFEFDPSAPSFGQRNINIINIELLNASGAPLAWAIGGEPITLCIHAAVHARMESPIVGFFVKDRLGQWLFGDNSYITYRDNPLACEAGTVIRARFDFTMPILPAGDYSIDVAVATGTQEEHIQQHWMHDALLFRSESTSVSTGLVGIPMHDIELEIIEE